MQLKRTSFVSQCRVFLGLVHAKLQSHLLEAGHDELEKLENAE